MVCVVGEVCRRAGCGRCVCQGVVGVVCVWGGGGGW